MVTSTHCHKTKPAFLYRNSLLKFFNLLSFWRTIKYFTANTVSLLIIVMLPFTALTESLLLFLSHLCQLPTELANQVLGFFFSRGRGRWKRKVNFILNASNYEREQTLVQRLTPLSA